MLLRARVVLPVAGPLLEDGAVRIAADRIAAVGRWRDLAAGAGPAVDLGDVVLLPGLINAHCHLDYSDMAGQIARPRSFTDWIKAITAAKGGLIYADFARAWLAGAEMLLRHGTTLVADVETVPELLPEVWTATPLRVHSFLELTGVRSRRDPASLLAEAVATLEALPPSRNRAGLSPHAPYSTVPELLRQSASLARARGWRRMTHVSESRAEFEMFSEARGEMFDWLQRNGRDMSDCGGRSPVQQLEDVGYLGGDLLAVHVNYLGADDAALLGRRGVHVVHCPRSHRYFGHEPFRYRELVEAGVNVCLGTDSLATVVQGRGERAELDLLAELREFTSRESGVTSAEALRLVTINAARALGAGGQVGELSPGACADLLAIPFSGPAAEAESGVIQHRDRVRALMIDGRWILPPPE